MCDVHVFARLTCISISNMISQILDLVPVKETILICAVAGDAIWKLQHLYLKSASPLVKIGMEMISPITCPTQSH